MDQSKNIEQVKSEGQSKGTEQRKLKAVELIRSIEQEQMKEEFAKVEITKLPMLLQEVQRRIDMINQKEAFETSEDTKIQINKAMLNVLEAWAEKKP